MNSIFAIGAILFGVLSLVICHFRAVEDRQYRRQWSTAFVASAGLLFLSGCLSVAVVPSTTFVSDEDKEFLECIEDIYNQSLVEGKAAWYAKQNGQHETRQQPL